MRLIDADALRRAMYHEAFETDSDMQKWDSGCWIRFKMFENAIEAQPTIEPVKTGKWIYDTQFHWYRASCSECGYMRATDIKANNWNGWKYCPNCGARMSE